MKTVAFGVSGLAIFVFTIVAVVQLSMNHTYTVNVQDNLQRALERSLATAMSEHTYDINSQEELIADVIENIALYMRDGVDLSLDVKAIDISKGIVSMKATASYTTASGDISVVEAERTVILESYVAFVDAKYTIAFVCKDNSGNSYTYKSYLLSEGANLLVPADPYDNFSGWWLNGKRYTINEIKQLKATKNMVFTDKK